MAASLEPGQGAVVMTNGDRGSGLFNEILRAIAREYDWSDYRPVEKTVVPVDPVTYHAYAGEYEASGLPRTIISTDAGQLYASASPLGPKPVRLYPSAEDHFFILEGNIEVNFRRDTNGNIIELQSRLTASRSRQKK